MEPGVASVVPSPKTTVTTCSAFLSLTYEGEYTRGCPYNQRIWIDRIQHRTSKSTNSTSPHSSNRSIASYGVCSLNIKTTIQCADRRWNDLRLLLQTLPALSVAEGSDADSEDGVVEADSLAVDGFDAHSERCRWKRVMVVTTHRCIGTDSSGIRYGCYARAG